MKYVIKPYRVEVADSDLLSVSVERAKEQLNIYDNDSDSLLTRYIRTSTQFLQEWLNYFLVPTEQVAVYNYCTVCNPSLVISARPFKEIVKIEALQDGAYITLDSSEYTVARSEWETFITFCDGITVDTGCIEDTIKVTYRTGIDTELDISTIASDNNIAVVNTVSAHRLTTGELVTISATGEPELDGVYSVTVLSNIAFSYSYLGTAELSSNEGVVIKSNTPPQLVQAVLEMVARMYTNRGDCADSCGQIPCAVQGMAGQFKRRILRTSVVRDVCCCQ